MRVRRAKAGIRLVGVDTGRVGEPRTNKPPPGMSLGVGLWFGRVVLWLGDILVRVVGGQLLAAMEPQGEGRRLTQRAERGRVRREVPRSRD